MPRQSRGRGQDLRGRCPRLLGSSGDVARVGGITPWLKVAHLAEAFNVAVCPHFLMELHVSLVAAVPNGHYVEHIPQLRAVTAGELEIARGHALAPETAGLGIDWDRDAIEDRVVA